MSFFRKPSDPHPTPTLFPTFLLPAIPFRRRSRQSSTDSDTSILSSSTTATSPTATLPDLDPTPVISPEGKFLSGHASHLRCSKCSTDLCLTSQIISKGFTGRHGRAYLVQGQPSCTTLHSHSGTLPNTYLDKAVPRQLISAGMEIRRGTGGKPAIQSRQIHPRDEENHGRRGLRRMWYDDFDYAGARDDIASDRMYGVKGADEAVEFDSQDEDECEDLFAGVWSPELALKRRRGRKFGRADGGVGGSGGRAKGEDVG
ncbi:hypothetical protein EPUS_06679 [Endocarpon pusillum Z07020]|uniref:Yippee domain-containing protein n=1 Tax=Endocarpon pusillum (strain Z07020 / HMAS-L-300199) TaxID=1263415 RepID=U1FVX1_ENDPU|nr:uncharacterized protein EPUS_06679 [Endocarpon pusillum Z07020]ERF68992.1 hypothetical protein EPUS_06679 [Endocarpon pusillum Z07020]